MRLDFGMGVQPKIWIRGSQNGKAILNTIVTEWTQDYTSIESQWIIISIRVDAVGRITVD